MNSRTHLLGLAVLGLAVAPAHAAELAFDDFSTYSTGNISGQAGAPTGFAGSWTSPGGADAAVDDSTELFTQNVGPFRSHRNFSSTPLASSGTIYIRTNLQLGTAGFVALELATTANSDVSAVRLIGGANLSLGTTTTGSGSGTLLSNDAANHEWLIELDLDTGAGQVWIDPNTAAFNPAVGGAAFTAPDDFELNAINVATFSAGTPGVVVDDFQVGEDWSDVGVTLGDPAPTLSLTNPADDSVNVPVAVEPVATFSEPIALTGSGSITLKNLSGGADIPVTLPGDVDITGAVLTITPASLLVAGDEYAVEITSDALEDLSVPASPYAGILATDVPNWSFTTDGTAPVSSGMSPMAGAPSASSNSGLVLTFDEEVVAGTGDITIHLAGGSLVETIDVASAAVTIAGNLVWIDISDLALSTAYYVNVAAGAFVDLSGNDFGGITDTTTWSFTTWAAVPTLPLAFDDFSTYTTGNISGQAGTPVPTGFAGSWTSPGGANAAVDDSTEIFTQLAGPFRSYRSFSAAPLISSGTVYLRVNAALGTAPGSFQAIELVPTANSDADSVRLVGGANLSVFNTGSGGANSPAISVNDGLNHEWFVELNLDTGVGRVWLDANPSSVPSSGAAAFIAPDAFQLNAINLATFAGPSETPSVALDDIQIGETWESIGVGVGGDLKVTSITKAGATVTVQFEGIDGETYDLNKSTVLDFTTPDIKDTVTLSGTTTGTLEDTTASEDAAFYRVEQQ